MIHTNGKLLLGTIQVLLLLTLLVIAPNRTQATMLSVPLLDPPMEICTSPTLKLLSHGPQSKSFYRFTLEIDNCHEEKPFTFALDPKGLLVYEGPDAETMVANPKAENTGPLWVTYDGNIELRTPVRRMSIVQYKDNVSTPPVRKPIPYYTSTITVPSGAIYEIDLDFSLPENLIPKDIKLEFAEQPLGENHPSFNWSKTLPTQGQKTLLLLQKK